MKRQRRSVFLALWLGSVACEQAGPATSVTVTDSAGIQIVSSSRAAWADGHAWTITAQPSLRIGSVDGDTLYQFNRLVDAVRLSDGRLAVADHTISRITFFASDGSFLSAIGRHGRGPGEFESLSHITRLRNDTLLAFDSRLNRVTFFDSQGQVLSTLDLNRTTASPIGSILRLHKGDLVTHPTFSSAQLSPPVQPGLLRLPTPVLRFDSRGQLLDTLGMFPGMEMSITVEGSRTGISIPPFAHTLGMAVHEDRIFVATGETYEIMELDSVGTYNRAIRRTDADLSITPESLAAFKQANLDQARDADARAFEAQRLATVPVPATKPAFSRILTDPSGNIWLSPFESNAYSERGWSVFNSNGHFLGEVFAPDGLHLLEIGDDYVLGRWRDDMQVEYLQLHVLVKE